MRTVFFVGKGGVGKTTSSASLAFHLASAGGKVYWVSIDPAHNLCDIAGCRPFRGAREIAPNLLAEEIDMERCTEAYIEKNIARMKETYRYLGILNLDGAFDILRYSPGMEEAAVTAALADGIRRYRERIDCVVVDTPPTGLMLRIFALPFTSILWIEKLSEWRRTILGRRKTVNSILGKDSPYREAGDEAGEDPVLRELGVEAERASFLKAIFADACVVLVTDQERLSLDESLRIRDGLARIGIGISLVLLNKFRALNETGKRIIEAFSDRTVVKVPFVEDTADRKVLAETAAGWAELITRTE